MRASIAAIRGSLLASRFSASVIVSTRSVSISSISVPSKKSPGLSGAISGKSGKMIGDASTTPLATTIGYSPLDRHLATAATARAGGSIGGHQLATRDPQHGVGRGGHGDP